MKDYRSRHPDIEAAMRELEPRVLPPRCDVITDCANAKVYRWKAHLVTLAVILEVEVIDGELWAHMSVAAHEHERQWRKGGSMVTRNRVSRVPSWDELRRCKELFLGDRKAVQVLPCKAEYVNVNPAVLHLYSSLERDPLPDFRGIDETGLHAI